MMKYPILTIALSICCCLLLACEANTDIHPIHTTSSNTAIATEIANQQAILIDVRTADEYAAGHAAQAILLPYDVIEQKIAQIAPNKIKKFMCIVARDDAQLSPARPLNTLGIAI